MKITLFIFDNHCPNAVNFSCSNILTTQHIFVNFLLPLLSVIRLRRCPVLHCIKAIPKICSVYYNIHLKFLLFLLLLNYNKNFKQSQIFFLSLSRSGALSQRSEAEQDSTFAGFGSFASKRTILVTLLKSNVTYDSNR